MSKSEYLECINNVMIGRESFDEKCPIDGLRTYRLNVTPATISTSNGSERAGVVPAGSVNQTIRVGER
jgi:hypothetical protein